MEKNKKNREKSKGEHRNEGTCDYARKIKGRKKKKGTKSDQARGAVDSVNS